MAAVVCLGLTGCFGGGGDDAPAAESSRTETEALPSPSPLQTRAPQLLKKNTAPIPEPKAFLPDRLIIPAIHVDTKLKPVTVLENGQVDVPRDTDIAGILYPGILPGQKGNVIIDGHVDSYTGPAVFFHLKKLLPGNDIILTGAGGWKLTYEVESVEVFKPAEAPLERIFGPSGNRRLNLITCTGRYSRKKKEHEHRLVIFAKLGGVK
ncbi:Sortase family protein [compost metagenome]